jgi:pyridoxal phosphate enzyme (YggS family)
MINLDNYNRIISELKPFNASLVAVSKTKPIADIKDLMQAGQVIFGENYVRELQEKHELIDDAEWHFIGHLQSNKVKDITPFVSLIHGIDSLKLLIETDKQSRKSGRIQNCLLQVHIAKEETKFGLSFSEADELLNDSRLTGLSNICIQGFMGMATATDDDSIIRNEFKSLRIFFEKYKSEKNSILSMGMTSDYMIALEEGSNMIRIGSAIFGERN